MNAISLNKLISSFYKLASDPVFKARELLGVGEEEEQQAEPVKTYPANQEFLYHITFYSNMSSISSIGLMPGSGELLGHGGNAGRSSGSVFLTDKSSISHWYNKIKQMAEHGSDNILRDEVIPVVLRTRKLNEDKEDDTAEQYGMYDEYVRKSTISPDELEIWNGAAWVPVSSYESINLESALDAHPADEDGYEDGDGDDIYYYFKDSSSNPLIP